MATTLRIATRNSRLALWQAHYVRDAIRAAHADVVVELLPMTTTGDRIIDRPLAQIGGKGLFIKELETALYEGRADIAVHSMKDVPVEMPEGLTIPVITQREDPRDAFVSRGHVAFERLSMGATIGTSSLRRKSQLMQQRDDLEIRDLRGNVPTRLEKLHSGEFDAIVLACAGLSRLGFGHEISQRFDVVKMIPAVGQGAIGIECREEDATTQAIIAPLHHLPTARCVSAERAMSRRLLGGCDVPLAAFAEISGDQLTLSGMVASGDGKRIIRDQANGPLAMPSEIGDALGASLLERGAGDILAEIRRATAPSD